jgi:hydrogenase maturation protease
MTGGVAIAGAGNILAADDGVGVRAIRDLEARSELPPGVRLLEIGTLGPCALGYLYEDEAVVLLDATRGHGPPGTIYRIDLEELERLDAESPRGAPLSVHDLGPTDLLREARLLGRPIRGVLLGVEPACLGPIGAPLSGPVAAALPRLRETALEEARRLLVPPGGGPPGRAAPTCLPAR